MITNLVIITLVVLIAYQVFFLLRRTRIKGPESLPDAQRAANMIKAIRKSSRQVQQKSDPVSKIDSQIFSTFQKNLNNSSKAKKDKSSDSAEEDEVIVSISEKGRKVEVINNESKRDSLKAAAANPIAHSVNSIENLGDKATSKLSIKEVSKNMEVAPIGPLFDDIEESLEASEANENQTKTVNPGDNKAKIPLISHEILTAEDLEPDGKSPKDEADIVLLMARKEFEVERYEETLATLTRYFQTVDYKNDPKNQFVKLFELKADCEFALRQFERSSKTYQEIFKKYIKKDTAGFLTYIEKLIEKFADQQQQQYAVHFMFTALNEYRQHHEHGKMDQTYLEI
ncbi:hypothetical protein KKA14_02820, partial [bacterium]|nr:hypothetical protein [bacterium]